MRTIALLIVAVFLWNATVHEVLAQGQTADIRIIPIEEDNRGESPRTVQVQIQDVSRGPLGDVQVTFTLPSAKDGRFSNGSNTINATTDNQGLATVSFEPKDRNARVKIAVVAQYQQQRLTGSVLSGGITKPKGNSKKWTYILGIVGGAAAAGAFALRKGKTPNGPITITPGNPTIVGP
jgi:hypothetical protein